MQTIPQVLLDYESFLEDRIRIINSEDDYFFTKQRRFENEVNWRMSEIIEDLEYGPDRTYILNQMDRLTASYRAKVDADDGIRCRIVRASS